MSKRSVSDYCHVRRYTDAAELSQEYLHLVSEVAGGLRNHLPASVDLKDLIADGNVGLVEAAQRFNRHRGASFRTFATCRIRGAMADGLRKRDSVSRDLRRQQKTAERVIAAAITARGCRPTEEEIAGHLGISLARWKKRRLDLYAAGCLLSGDPSTDQAVVLPENLPDVSIDPERSAALAELRSRLGTALRLLPPRHRTVVWLYHLRGLTMSQIAVRIGVTEGRVSQIHKCALAELRTHLSLAGVHSSVV